MTHAITIDIRPADALSRTEQVALRALGAGAGYAATRRYPYVWADPHWHLLAWHHDTLVSHLDLTEQRGSTAGQSVQLVGIGNLLTHPAYRGQGLATRAQRQARHVGFTTLGADVAMLWCAPHLVPFYVRRGWQLMQASVMVAQPHGTLVWPELAMVLPRPGMPWTDAPLVIDGYPW